QADGAQVDGEQADGEQADEGAVVAVERRVDLDFTDYVATDDHTVFLYDAELGAVLVNTDEVQTADGVVVTLGSAADEAQDEEQDEAQDEDAPAAAEAGQAEKAALIITGDGEYEQGGVTYAVSGLVLPGETGAQSDEGDGAQDEAAEDTAADDTAVDDTAADETDDGAQSGEGGEAAERRVDLDFTDYIATDEHAVYLYDASMVAVLVNTAEIASVDGVAVGMPEAEAAGDAEQAENDADNADNTDNTENDADRAENDADRAEAEMPADATTVLIITGDGEYALNGTTYAVTGLVLPEKTVGNDNITIATANDEATLLNVAPVFEETDEDYDDIFSLFTAAKDDPTLLAKVVDLLGGVAYAEEDGEAGRELNVKVFNIALQDITTGEAVEPGTELHVETSLEKPIEGENFALYHIADGKAKLIDDAVVVEDGKAVGLNFNTVSLDKFALVYYTVNVTVEEKTITVDVDFTDVVENGVDFDSQTLLTALNDGVAIGVESLLSGDAESALSVNIEGDDLNVDIAALSESFSEGGVSFADGSVKVTGDGSITLTDGTYTLNINVTHYTRLLEMELKAEGVSVEVLDGEVPAGSTVSYEALSDGDTTRLVEEYREIIDTSEASGEAGEADNTEEPEAGAPEEGAEETGDAADQAAEAGDTADETAGEDGAEEAAGEGENTVKTETATGYTAFDVSIAMPEGDAFTEGGQFAVTVDHAVDAASLVPEGAVVDRITYALFHIHEGEATAIDDVTVTDGQVSFTTDSFSEYVIRYTVDFEYIDPETGKTYVWSWPGVGSYTLSDILWMFDVTEPVESATLTRIMDIGGAENCLYLEQKDGEWVLTSETAFHDVFELVVVAGGVEYTIIVTDAGEIDLQTIAKNDSTGIVISESSTPTPDGYSRSSTYSVHLNYAIDNSKLALARANNTWVYDLSSFFNNPDVPFSGFPEGVPQSGPITENNMTKGRYYIQSDKVYFEMNQSFINTHTDITGTLDITLQLDETKVGSKGESEFTFPGTTDELTITYKAVDVSDSWKAVNNNQSGIVAVQEENGNYRLNYTASVRPNAALDSLVMNDTLGAGQTLDKSSFVIKTESGKTYTVPASAIQDTATGFTLDIATVVKAAGDSIKSGTKYEVTYSTKVDADKVDGEHNITNRINWEWEGGSKPTNETDVRPKRATTIDKAVAATDGDGETYIKTLTYTITVGDNNHKDVSGVKVQDYMQDYQLLDGNIVIRDASGSAVYTIADSELKWTNDATFSDNQKALFEYTFPANSNNGPYTITYTTKVPADVGRDGQVNITNRVNTGDGSSDDTGVPVDFGTRPGPGASIDKAFAGWAEKDSDGKVTSNWTIDVNVAADAELPLQNVVVTETDCYTAPSGWYPHTDATVDYTSIVVKDKATGNVIDSYTVDEDAGT
ncbi:MAG: hypothetical protein IKE76_06400, partial [Clostridia bacterium]|nr:hypothetical protein [Clostridia bacterium]